MQVLFQLFCKSHTGAAVLFTLGSLILSFDPSTNNQTKCCSLTDSILWYSRLTPCNLEGYDPVFRRHVLFPVASSVKKLEVGFPKGWYLPTKPHGFITAVNTTNIIFSSVRPPKFRTIFGRDSSQEFHRSRRERWPCSFGNHLSV
jgi:hypothetical protein